MIGMYASDAIYMEVYDRVYGIWAAYAHSRIQVETCIRSWGNRGR